MISDNPTDRQFMRDTGAVAPAPAEGSYLDWPAIFAGGVFALAISFLLISFGTGLGLSLTSPYRSEGVSAAWLVIAAGIWFAWVMVTAFGAGGYLAGRMRRRIGDATEDEVAVRDGAHGLMVWATGALVSTVVAAAGVGGVLGAGAAVVGTSATTLADAASDAASSEYFANLILRGATDGSEAGSAATPRVTPGAETPVEDSTTGSAQALVPAGPVPTSRQDAPRIDPAVQQEIAGILGRSAASGDVAERDRTYLAQLVAANSSLDAQAADARVEEVTAEIAEARAAALATVEDARVAGVIFGFIAAATLLAGAIAAFFAATLGGRHRDEGLGPDALFARR